MCTSTMCIWYSASSSLDNWRHSRSIWYINRTSKPPKRTQNHRIRYIRYTYHSKSPVHDISGAPSSLFRSISAPPDGGGEKPYFMTWNRHHVQPQQLDEPDLNSERSFNHCYWSLRPFIDIEPQDLNAMGQRLGYEYKHTDPARAGQGDDFLYSGEREKFRLSSWSDEYHAYRGICRGSSRCQQEVILRLRVMVHKRCRDWSK